VARNYNKIRLFSPFHLRGKGYEFRITEEKGWVRNAVDNPSLALPFKWKSVLIATSVANQIH